MNRCSAPCVGNISKGTMLLMLNTLNNFQETKNIILDLQRRWIHILRKDYERAAYIETDSIH